MARTKAPKPTRTFVEVDSDDEVEEPRLSGPLRGLNPAKDRLPNAATQSTVKVLGDESDIALQPLNMKQTTRASRGNGKAILYVCGWRGRLDSVLT